MASAQTINQNFTLGSANSDSQRVYYDKAKALPEKLSNWSKFRLTPKADQMQAELHSLVTDARQFISEHSTGTPRSRALNGLAQFDNLKVNCKKTERDATIYGLTRKNLKTFNQLLKNDRIPIEQRITAAENLFETLGVCNEGVSSKVQTETENLHLSLFGLTGKFKQTKIATLKEIVHELVQELAPSADHLKVWDEHYANDFNNALVDQMGEDLGIQKKQDAYLGGSFSNPAAKHASTVVEQFLSPELVINNLADELELLIEGSLGVKSGESIAWNSEKFETLSDNLRAGFYGELTLHDILDMDTESQDIAVKSREQMIEILVSLGKEKGVVPKDVIIKNLSSQKRPSVRELVQSLGLQKITHAHAHAGIKLLLPSWLNLNTEQTERKKKRSNQSAHGIQNPKAIELFKQTNSSIKAQ